MTVLLDTSFLIATTLRKDIRHQVATRQLITLGRKPKIVVEPVLIELFQIVAARTYYGRAIDVMVKTRTLFEIAPLTSSDLSRHDRYHAAL
jgi:predicted nucleic acid-binding protein